MEYTTRIREKGSNSCPISTIDYALGILHTYAALNAPDSTLTYEYNLIELPGTAPLELLLKEQFFIFRNQEVRLEPMQEAGFISALTSWLFTNGALSRLNLGGQRMGSEAGHFRAVLRDVLRISHISLVTHLSDHQEATYLELGVAYQYFILHAPGKNYLLYFRYDD